MTKCIRSSFIGGEVTGRIRNGSTKKYMSNSLLEGIYQTDKNINTNAGGGYYILKNIR